MQTTFTFFSWPTRFVASFFLAFMLVGAVSSAQAQEQASAARVFGSVAEPQGDLYSKPERLVPELMRVTYYRPGPALVLGSARLEVNGRYHTTLQVGSYTEVCLPPGDFNLGVRMVQNGLPFDAFPASDLVVQTRASQDLFLRVSDLSDGRTELELVDPLRAQEEIKSTKRQQHAVSRVQQSSACIVDVNSAQGLASAAGAVKARELIVLGVSSLFVFGESDFSSISDQGQNDLAALVARIQNTYGDDDSLRIEVTGHADPLGRASANRRVSALRAQAVRDFMVQQGVNADRISSVGVGSSDLVVSSCGKNITKKSIECNQPNRRVVVGIQVLSR